MKAFVMISILSVVFSAKSFAAECWVVGQDSSNLANYNQLIKHIPAGDFEKSPILYQTDKVIVSYSRPENGKLSLVTSQPATRSVSASAFGTEEELSLIDGHLGLAVYCRK